MKRTPTTVTLAVLGVATVLGLSACSTQVAKPAAPTVENEIAATEKGGVRSQAVTIRATVEKVDPKSRRVSLVGFDGTRETLTVSPAVQNLPQVRKGDEVVVTYYQAAAFEVLAKGEKRDPATVAAGIGAAPLGAMPAGVAADVTTLVVDVVRLDPEKRTAVVRGPEGGIVSLDIRNPVVFEKVKVGDRVEIVLAEAVAIAVEPTGGR